MEFTTSDFFLLASLLVPLAVAAIGFVALYFVIKTAVSAALRQVGFTRPPS